MTRFDRAPWPELSVLAEARAVLLLPLGSTEQHGPHLPVTTDTDIAVALAEGAASQQPRLVVAPAVAYGSSGEHQAFAGTLSIGREVTEAVVVELVRSASTHFAHVVVVSAHGGNAVPLSRAVARLAAEGRSALAWAPAWPGDLHAGRTETSLMLAIAPGRVDLDRAEPGDTRTIGALLPIMSVHGVRSVSGNGVLGDPTGASADEGRELLARAVADLVLTTERLAGAAATGRAG
jgi:creatinine amidohydrolase